MNEYCTVKYVDTQVQFIMQFIMRPVAVVDLLAMLGDLSVAIS
jgi:hypothetical protein